MSWCFFYWYKGFSCIHTYNFRGFIVSVSCFLRWRIPYNPRTFLVSAYNYVLVTVFLHKVCTLRTQRTTYHRLHTIRITYEPTWCDTYYIISDLIRYRKSYSFFLPYPVHILSDLTLCFPHFSLQSYTYSLHFFSISLFLLFSLYYAFHLLKDIHRFLMIALFRPLQL